MKSIEISVNYRGSKNPKVLIELSPHIARQLLDGHQNIHACFYADIKKALEFIEANREPKEE